MSRVAVFATIEVAPGTRDDVSSRILEHRERCLRDEPGTLTFEVMLPREAPDRIHLYEVYRDQAAFDAHWNGPSLAQFRRETEGKMAITAGIWGAPIT